VKGSQTQVRMSYVTTSYHVNWDALVIVPLVNRAFEKALKSFTTFVLSCGEPKTDFKEEEEMSNLLSVLGFLYTDPVT